MDEHQRTKLLSTCPFFAGLPAEDLQSLAGIATLRRYRHGQLLFCEGDDADSLLVVAEGRLKAYSTSADGDEFVLDVIEVGDSVGEVSLADGGARSATVEALSDAAVLRLPREAVLDLAANSPALTKGLLAAVASVVRRLTGAAADLVFLDLPRRVAKLVLEQGRTSDTAVIDMPLSQTEIARRVGASRQSVNAALRDFERRGWISSSGRAIRIRNAAALSRFVGT